MKNIILYTFVLLFSAGTIHAGQNHYYATPATMNEVFNSIEQTYESNWALLGISTAEVFDFIEDVANSKDHNKNCIGVRVSAQQLVAQTNFSFLMMTSEDVIEVNYLDPKNHQSSKFQTSELEVSISELNEKYYIFTFAKQCGDDQSGLYIIIVDMDRILKAPSVDQVEYLGGPQLSPTAPVDLDVKTYPNPFVTQTSIQFHLMEESRVSVQIVDLLRGVPVAALLEETLLNSGSHTLDADLDGLSAGIYSCIISLNGQLVESRMIKLE